MLGERMKFGRGRVIAVALLSTVLALLLSSFGFLLGFSRLNTRADDDIYDPTHIPTFDESYVFEPITTAGQVVLGQNQSLTSTFALRDENYRRDSISALFNATQKQGFSSLQTKRNRQPYALFTDADLQSMVNGMTVNDYGVEYEDNNKDGIFNYTDYNGNKQFDLGEDDQLDKFVANCLQTPIVMLDMENVDQVVVLELLNLPLPPTIQKMTRNGETLPTKNIILGQGQDADYVYGGVRQETMTQEEVAAENERRQKAIAAQNAAAGLTEGMEGGIDPHSQDLDYNSIAQAGAYETIGAMAVCTSGVNCSLRGVFNEEGLYEFAFELGIPSANGTTKTVELAFSFYLVAKAHYAAFPSFPAENRAAGDGNVYNYSFGGTYPTVSYSENYFDVAITSTEQPNVSTELSGNTQLQFYAIGEYVMTSHLKYRYFNSQTGKYRELRLLRYRPNVSTLNIRGFQAYYGGQHQKPEYNGPLPFYNTTDSSINSNITPWVTSNGHNSTNKNPDVSDAMQYAQQLTDIVDREGLTPLRTNFPPVKIIGNVNHASGAGLDGTMTRLSTVSFQGVADATWNEPTTFEPGQPFTDAGRYLVIVYFWVNKTLCQQTFYFEISNALAIQFAVTDGDGYHIFSYDQLVRDQKYQGQDITIMYNGMPQLGEFEVPPTLTLERASLSDVRHFTDITNETKPAEDGAFNFRLLPACYRLKVTYGAYGQTTTVIELVVDDTEANDITTTSNFKQTGIADLPTNTAIWGAGEIALSWAKKDSGIGFHNVKVDYYRTLIENPLTDPNANINYTNYNANNTKLFSATVFDTERTASNNFTPVLTDDRWCLTETFKQAGLYKLTIEDDVGNETQYLLIIDQAKPSFVQDSKEPNKSANIVDFGDDGVRVGFGRQKLVKALSGDLFTGWKQFDALRERNIIITDSNSKALAVPIAKVEMNINGGAFQSLSRADLERGYVTLYDDDTYYFRVTDVLGNLSEYYIILTHDQSLGMIYAEDSAQNFASDQGYVDADPNLSTSIVTAKGGMTNRNYVTFSFQQVEKTASYFRVKNIKMEYYPFTFDTKSRNYPFAASPVNYLKHQDNNGIIYATHDEDSGSIDNEPAQAYRLALYNKGETTRRGLYIITRTYYSSQGTDDYTRAYYFIVDDQPLLHYEPEVYQTDLRIRFGADDKIAYAADFDYFNYELRSNRAAEIAGFVSKYNGTTRYLGYDFPSLIPRFSYINNGQTTNLGEGSIYEIIGNEQTGDVTFKLIVADNARNFPAILNQGNVTEIIPEGKITSANYSELSLVLDTGYGTKAKLIKNSNYDAPISTTQMEYQKDTCVYTYVVDPDDLSALTFEFESDPRGFYADIDFPATDDSWATTGFNRTFTIAPEIDGTTYRYDIYDTFLNGVNVNSGYSIRVSLITKDNQQTDYNILFDLDTGEPTYNLQRIIQQDNLAKDMEELPDGYIYGLSTDFVFTADQSENRYLDTKEISYREVNYQGEGSLTKTIFRLADGRPFADLVGLRDNEMKYYWITETDYAGHVADYIVQIQGEKYKGDITYVGAFPDKSTDDNTVLGIEMRVSTASAHQFYLNNKSFKFVNDDEYYAVYCGTAQWYLNGKAGTGASSEAELVSVLNEWINDATERGERCRYLLYDRMGDPKVFACYNLREDAATLQLEAYNLIPNSVVASPVCLQTINYDQLPLILKDPALAEFYQMEIIDVATQKPLDNMAFILGLTTLYNIRQGQELIIKVTDPFERVSITEYHGQDEVGLRFVPYGNTVDLDQVTYVGDSRGVQFSFLRTVYSINVYNDETGALITNLPTFVQGDKVTYTFTPSSSRADTSRYRIEAIGRSSHAVLYEKIFAFDTRLPQVIWTNTSDQQIAVNNNTFTGTVNMRVVPDDLSRFTATISYQRTVNGAVERVTLPSGTRTYQFDQIGDYTVTLRSQIWASVTYTFKIANISDTLVNVFDDNQLLTPSASRYAYEDKVIDNYIFTMETRLNDLGEEELLDLTHYDAHGLQLVPAESSNRQLVWYNEKQAYQDYDRQNNTLIWRFAVPAGEDEFGRAIYVNDLYLATTGVPRTDLNGDNKIRLVINDDTPLEPFYVTSQVLTLDNLPKTGFKLRLNGSQTLDTAANNYAPCYTYQGNLVLIDCYRNGQLIKTLAHDETFTLTAADAGYYQFRVRDMVGNTLLFGSGAEQQDYYAVVVLTKPMVVINNSEPVKHMVYNDRVEFKIIDDADELLRAEYGNEFFEQNFKIASLEVTCNGEPVDINLQYNPTSFVWTQKGTYLIRLKYQIGENLQQTIEDQYEFEILPSRTAMLNWSMNVYPDLQILSIRRNNYLIRDFGEPAVGEALHFAADENPGSYEITLQSYNSLIGYQTHAVKFNIDYKNSHSVNYFWLDTASGLATTASVTLTYQAKMLYYARGECTVVLYKDFNVVEQRDITASSVAEMELDHLETLYASEVGMYTVQVFDVEGDVVYADSWTIEANQSSVGYIITAVVAGIAGIGIIIFIRLRHKMKVK